MKTGLAKGSIKFAEIIVLRLLLKFAMEKNIRNMY